MLKLNNFSKKYRIYYEDTDSGGVVYYANYLKFYERARTDFLREINISQTKLSNEENLVFVVKRCEINYLKPAKLDDLIEVFVEIKEIKPASIKMSQKIMIDEKTLSQLEVEIVCVDKDIFRPKKIPQKLQEILKK